MGFVCRVLLLCVIMTVLLGQVTMQAKANDVCDKCMRGRWVVPCSSYAYCHSFPSSDVIQIGKEYYRLSEVDNVQCSEINNGTEFKKLKAKLKNVVQKEKEWPRSIWPCLKRQGNLGVLRLIIVNIGLCYPYLQPIMEEMHEKFKKNKKTTTRILKWLKTQFVSSGYGLNHLFDVSGVVIGLKLQDKYGNLKNQLGSKCYKRLTKLCRCM